MKASLLSAKALKDRLPADTPDDAILINIKGGPGSGFYGHAGRQRQVGGSSSASGTGMSTVSGTAYVKLKDVDCYVPNDIAQSLNRMLKEGIIQPKHFKACKLITYDPPAGFVSADDGFKSKIFGFAIGNAAAGIYKPSTKSLAMHQKSVTEQTFVHELGHAVDTAGNIGKRYNARISRIISSYRAHRIDIETSGYRPYSFSSNREFVADTFLGLRYAKGKHKAYLEQTLRKYKLDKMAGELR